ncbi:chorismate mutase [Thiohalospira halophila DSM 15071]|uniref:Bifunctional chorismate mutase/prephenate dehydratase n=1 Tax=Thiohalospira halophila DSM 15071 TaxID=1123397 RepID=A0A1I1PDH3_9GAMM|nr:prephenate dehydratase [Thiohalospira halophila]SFD07662.1 chorismate mutase [Thiohalospira halophila DSM 15071]
MADDNGNLEGRRQRIDAIDAELQALLNERARLAGEIAEIKRAEGVGEAGFYRPEREAQVLRSVRERNQGPLPDDEVVRLFREIMSACLALERPLTVAFLGPEGTFTEAALDRHFGQSVARAPMGSIGEVFREVEAGTAHYGVVPVENSTEGVVTHTLDRFVRSPLAICGEVVLRIHQQLLARPGADLAGIQRVYSHQQSLAQCREWLDTHLPEAERVAMASNAEAARQAADEEGAAAIAAAAAADHYELAVLAANIEDEPDNTTRFLVIGPEEAGPSGADKTTLVVSGRNRSGTLQALLAPVAAHGLNLTRVESRPSRQAVWEYLFFLDIEGHRQDPAVAAALAELEAEASFYRILGSYPQAAT